MNKTARNKIYKKTLVEYKNSIPIRENYGICHALRCVILQMVADGVYPKQENLDRDGIPVELDPYLSLEAYPELLACKPSKTHSDVFWFSFDETKVRIDILNKIIIETSRKNTTTITE